MATRRSNSWFAFLCEGSTSTLLSGTEVPASMLHQFLEEVRDTRIFRVSEMHTRIICPRILESNNCDRPANCPNLHPDFIAERWAVPDLICHQWFQGVCGFGDRCWHQHGDTFDSAMRLSVQTQTSPRREGSAFLYDPQNGGTIRQINREEAARMISTSLAQFRLNTIRKWHFGTNWTTYYDYPSFARSDLAQQIWADEDARRDPDSDEEYLPCNYYPFSPEWPEKVQKTLWNLAHRGFRLNSEGDQTPVKPYPWQLRSHKEWCELNDDLQNRFGICLIWRARDCKCRSRAMDEWHRIPFSGRCHPAKRCVAYVCWNEGHWKNQCKVRELVYELWEPALTVLQPKEKLRKFFPMRNIVIDKNKDEKDEYSKYFPAISFVDYGAISSQIRDANKKFVEEKRKHPPLQRSREKVRTRAEVRGTTVYASATLLLGDIGGISTS